MIEPDLSVDGTVPATPKTLRQFACLWLLFFGGLASWQWVGRGRGEIAAALLVVGLAGALSGLLRPGAIKPLFTGMLLITLPIGRIMSYVLVGVLFYGLFTPVGLLFRLIGRDALSMRPHREVESYWTAKQAAADARSYLRQS